MLPAARLLADARELVLRQAPTGVIWPNDRRIAELVPYLDWMALVALVPIPALIARARYAPVFGAEKRFESYTEFQTRDLNQTAYYSRAAWSQPRADDGHPGKSAPPKTPPACSAPNR